MHLSWKKGKSKTKIIIKSLKIPMELNLLTSLTASLQPRGWLWVRPSVDVTRVCFCNLSTSLSSLCVGATVHPHCQLDWI